MLNYTPLNNNALNTVPLRGAGQLVALEQNVALIEGAGSLLSLEQDVQLRITGSGALIPLEQTVNSTQLGTLVSLEQNVLADTSVTSTGVSFDPVNNTVWDLILTLDGNIVPSDQIHGALTVTRGEGSTSLMDVTLIPEAGIQSASEFIGQTVTLDVITGPESTTRVYTGLVDIPELDIINKKITLRCADRREELIEAQIGPILSTVGTYSPVIFNSETLSTSQKLQDRLSTTPHSVDFDAYGILSVTAWQAKATADFTLDDTIVYYRDPTVELTSRGSIVNTINLTFEYRYERLHHWERNFTWTSPVQSNFAFLALQSRYTFAKRSTISSAISAAGWVLKSPISFVDVHPSGWYSGIAWITFTVNTQLKKAKDSLNNDIVDSDGNVTYEKTKDSDGNIVNATELASTTNYGDVFCEGASWTATSRWSQTIVEKYELSVTAPQSIAQFGAIEESMSSAYSDDFNSKEWEDYGTYSDDPVETGSYFLEASNRRQVSGNAIQVALQIAKTKILSSHRDTRVVIYRDIWPEIGLHHTVALTTTPIQCKGKVFQIVHSFNMGTREAFTKLTIVLSKAQGTATESSLGVPQQPADPYVLPTGTITLGNHFGIDPDPNVTYDADTWTGMIGNSGVTSFPVSFVVDVPEVPSSARDERVLGVTTDYDIEIPDDDLTITF